MCSNNVNSIILFNAISTSALKREEMFCRPPQASQAEGEREESRANMRTRIAASDRPSSDLSCCRGGEKGEENFTSDVLTNKFVSGMMNCLLVIVNIWEEFIIGASDSGERNRFSFSNR
jgi:hypothetical protein